MTNPLRVLIADDEFPARRRLRALLTRHADVEVVGECTHCEDAYQGAMRLRPDVLLLDVQMPDCDGFQMLKRLPAEARPVVIFVTAHVDFAFDAFEVEAADFVLKPFETERFDRALERARKMVSIGGASAVSPSAPRSRFVVRRRGDILILTTDEIDWIAGERNYVRLYAADRSYLIREALHKLEGSLGASFVRVHRSAIVNVDRIARLTSSRAGGTVILLKNGQSIAVGPAFREKLQALLGGDER
jgi:two-component system, LytTR family, response regulator